MTEFLGFQEDYYLLNLDYGDCTDNMSDQLIGAIATILLGRSLLCVLICWDFGFHLAPLRVSVFTKSSRLRLSPSSAALLVTNDSKP